MCICSQEEGGTGWMSDDTSTAFPLIISPQMDGENYNCDDLCEEHTSLESRSEVFSPWRWTVESWAMISGLGYYHAELQASAFPTNLHTLQCQAMAHSLSLWCAARFLLMLTFFLCFLCLTSFSLFRLFLYPLSIYRITRNLRSRMLWGKFEQHVCVGGGSGINESHVKLKSYWLTKHSKHKPTFNHV